MDGSITTFLLYAAWMDLLQQLKYGNALIQAEKVDFSKVCKVLAGAAAAGRPCGSDGLWHWHRGQRDARLREASKIAGQVGEWTHAPAEVWENATRAAGQPPYELAPPAVAEKRRR